MNNKFKLTQEEINKIIMHSPYALADSPAQKGLGAGQIKKYFYDFIRIFAEKINTHFEAVGAEFNNTLELIDNVEYAFELAVSGLLDKISKVEKTEKENNATLNAALEQGLSSLEERVESAYNLAAGKSRIIPVLGVRLMLGDLMYEEQTRGDLFIVGERGVPEFMFCRKSEEPQNGDIPFTEEQFLNGEITFEPGKHYYFVDAKKQLLTIESGFDTSSLVTKDELGEMDVVLDYIISTADLYIGGVV